jgi:hypothetical protein
MEAFSRSQLFLMFAPTLYSPVNPPKLAEGTRSAAIGSGNRRRGRAQHQEADNHDARNVPRFLPGDVRLHLLLCLVLRLFANLVW